MTFSIVARDGDSLGIAVASKFLAVGAVVPVAECASGAIATQAWANLRYRPDGLALLRQGNDASATLAELVAADPGRADRQAGIVDAKGGSATYTGTGAMDWAGGTSGPGYAVQGNILTGPEVVAEMVKVWLARAELPLAHRLLEALAAGDGAGGDRRGRQSAALLVVSPGGGYGGGSDVSHDLRVDDHANPVSELRRLIGIHDFLFQRPDPAECLELTGDLGSEVRTLLGSLGHPQPDLDVALSELAGIENFEERLVPGRIDPVVLEYLRRLVTGT
ncbi:MAG: DUF1028 domain-containing protein [Actinomycetes bacterium]